MTEFQFYLSSEINLNVRLRISHLEGSLKLPSVEDDPELRHTSFYNSLCRNLFITCSICANGKQLTIPVRTSFSDTNLRWTEWLVFPIKYQGLPLNSQVVITVWNVFAPRKKIPVGGTAFNLFTDSRRLRKGRQKLYLWPNREGDASAHSSTPGKSKERNEIDRLEHIVKKYDLNQVTRIDWLDKATFTEIEKLRKMSVESSNEKLYLNVELPTFEYPVVFNEREFEVPPTLPPNAVVVTIYDPEMQRKEANPIANKHLRLVSDVWKKLVDPNLRPNPEERDRIEKILAYPITKVLSVEDKDILWKYRFFLTSNKKALTKFLRCVDWSSSEETKQAADLINQWEHVEITDALELLSKSFLSSIVRDYAVATLEQASSEELSHYLLQLVQALRYDSQSSESRLASFLVKRSVQEKKLLNDLYWYLRVECEDPKYETFYKEQLNNFMRELSKTEEGKKCILDLKRQEDMIGWMNGIYKELKSMGKQPKKKKVAKFQELISPGNTFSNLGKFPFKIPIPVDPLNDASGVLIEKVNVFTSAMEPLGVPFLTQGKTYTVIFKSGDDLRQDQVIIQLISLMDNLLKKESLDLKLSPYAVLSTSTKDGMVQAVPDSKTITAILNEYGNDIHNYLRQGSNQIEPEVLNTFVRSCAGYCVITYLLCVGDRHLDNLLITKDGHLFHIDFGFIGRDPKPYPPPMKLCPEMVAAMGGEFDVSFKQFKSYCISAFNILRKNANLILNLMSLMLDSNISDLANERTLLQIQDKFLLDKNDEEASHYFQQLMAESVTALFPRIAEKIHKWKQYWDNR